MWKVQGNRGKKCGNLRNALDIVKNQKGRGRAQWFSCTGFQKAVLPVDHVEQTDSLQQSGLFQIDVECMFVLLISEVHSSQVLPVWRSPWRIKGLRPGFFSSISGIGTFSSHMGNLLLVGDTGIE